jgi:hypothetical protein
MRQSGKVSGLLHAGQFSELPMRQSGREIFPQVLVSKGNLGEWGVGTFFFTRFLTR